MIQDTVLVGGPGGGTDGIQQLGLPGPKAGQTLDTKRVMRFKYDDPLWEYCRLSL